MSTALGLVPLSLIVLVLTFQIQDVVAKVFDRCELAGLLQNRYGLPPAQVATLVCIAQHSSSLNTATFGGGFGPGGGSHGIFQISDVYWCSPPGQGLGCGVSCDRLRDDDIADDVLCVRKIYAEHQRISGDGFTAWQAYGAYCRQDPSSYVAGCGVGGIQSSSLQVAASHQYQQQVHAGSSQLPGPVHSQGKVYSRCELAQELYYQHQLPMQQIPTWVCIAQHESSFNTAAVGRLNADGSADHGLFQISDLFWCTHDQRGGKGCRASCNQFLDSSIADDVKCIKQIHQEHTHISGDGFTAWTVYNRNCRNQRYEQIAACFAKPQGKPPSLHPNAIGGAVTKISSAYSFAKPQLPPATTPNPYYRPTNALVTYQSTQATSSYQGNLFLRSHSPHQSVEPHPNAIALYQKVQYSSTSSPQSAFNTKHYTAQKQQQFHYHNQQQQQQQQLHYYTTPKRAGKVYKRCELAQELYFSHKFPMQDIATWVCIAEHESRLDTAAVGRLNTDGSADHGLFQISDLYWCTHGDGVAGKGCRINCNNLLDSYLADDVECIRTIYQEHTRISGNGFTAWTVYNGHCRNRKQAEIASCFNSTLTPTNEIILSQPKTTSKPNSKPKPKGKIYKRCELAQELYHRHNVPMQEIPTWVCIAQHESSYNTAAEGRLNGDGSVDHGLFQISDLFWCTHGEGGGKACNIECDQLLDADISDDIQCIRTIHEEHTRLTGDGFNAWTVYARHCRHQSLDQLSDCFATNEIELHTTKPAKIAPNLLQPVAIGNPFLQRFTVQISGQKPKDSVKPKSTTPPVHTEVVPKHPFGSNPFLQKFISQIKPSRNEAIIKNSNHVPATQRTTMQVSVHNGALPQNPFSSNPFLQKLSYQLNPVTNSKNNVVAAAATIKSSYDHNPFLKIAKNPSAYHNKPTEQENSSKNYALNPFLKYHSAPTLGPLFLKPTISSTPKSASSNKVPKYNYVNSETFRRETTTRSTTISAQTTIRPITTSRPTYRTIPGPTTTTQRTSRSTTTFPATNRFSSSTTRPVNPTVTTKRQSTIQTTSTPKTSIGQTKSPRIKANTPLTAQSTPKTTTTRSPARSTIRTTARSTSPIPTPLSKKYSTTTTHPTTRPPARTTARSSTILTTRTTRSTSSTTPRSTPTTMRPTTRSTSITTARSTPLYASSTSTRSTSVILKSSPSIPTTRSTTTSRPGIKATTRSTIRSTSSTTARPTFPISTPSTKKHATPTARPTNRPTTRTTARSTTRSTTSTLTRSTTTNMQPTTRPPTRTTTRSIRSTTSLTTRPTTRPTPQPTTRTTKRSTTPFSMPSTTNHIPSTKSPTTLSTTRTSIRTTARSNTRSPISTTISPTTAAKIRSTTPFTKQSTTISPTTRAIKSVTTTMRPFSPTWHSKNQMPLKTSILTTKQSTSTTPRPYLFTTTKRITTTTTYRPAITKNISTTPSPFDHPFFDKYKWKFEWSPVISSTTLKPTTNSQSRSSDFKDGLYYSKLQNNSVKVSAKTVYSHDFSLNRTTTTLRPN